MRRPPLLRGAITGGGCSSWYSSSEAPSWGEEAFWSALFSFWPSFVGFLRDALGLGEISEVLLLAG
jgi:hypothetical protein